MYVALQSSAAAWCVDVDLHRCHGQVMGGQGGAAFKEFRSLMFQGFLAARKHMDKLIFLVEIMQKGIRGHVLEVE